MTKDNFTIKELCDSDTAERMGIDNHAPPPQVLHNMYTTIAGMERVRKILGNKPVFVTSGFRCEKLERALTAKDFARWCAVRSLQPDEDTWKAYFGTKAHPRGWAVDFKCPGFGTPKQVAAAIVAADLPFDQCIEEGSWVHISFDPRMRRQALKAIFDANGTPNYSASAK